MGRGSPYRPPRFIRPTSQLFLDLPRKPFTHAHSASATARGFGLQLPQALDQRDGFDQLFHVIALVSNSVSENGGAF